MTPAEIATNLRRWRVDRSLTQREAAAKLGISYRTYEEAERGRGIAHPPLLRLALQALGWTWRE